MLSCKNKYRSPGLIESFEIATEFAYRNGEHIGIPKGGAMDCAMVGAAPVLPALKLVRSAKTFRILRLTKRQVSAAGNGKISLSCC